MIPTHFEKGIPAIPLLKQVLTYCKLKQMPKPKTLEELLRAGALFIQRTKPNN